MEAPLNAVLERSHVDDAVLTLTHIYILGAKYLLDVMSRAVSHYCLDENMTPEQKRTLKADVGFTSKAVFALGEAARGYQTMSRNLYILEEELNKKLISKADYTKQMANTIDLVSLDLVYLMLTEGNPENERAIHEFLKTFEWPQDLKSTYESLRAKCMKMAMSR